MGKTWTEIEDPRSPPGRTGLALAVQFQGKGSAKIRKRLEDVKGKPSSCILPGFCGLILIMLFWSAKKPAQRFSLQDSLGVIQEQPHDCDY